MPQRQNLSEARPQLAAEATGTAGRFRVQLINPGWGSSGYYSPEVLAEAARNRVFSAGLHMYADHARGDGSGVDRHGNRSVTDLWAVLETDATLDDTGALVAEARVFAPYRELVTDLREDIGLSIRALGSAEIGEAEGRRGQIITSIEAAASVDFVTSAGRGGRILEMVESAGGVTADTARQQLLEARNVGQWIESRLHLHLTQIADDMFGDGRLTREERISLSSAVGDALGAFVTSLEASQPQLYERDLWADPTRILAAEAAHHRALAEATVNDTRDALSTAVSDAYRIADKTWAYVRDWDPDKGLVYFEISGDDNGTFQQSFELASDGTASLTGTRTEVNVRTTYVPVDPAGQSNPEESEEDTMPQIEEARLRQLEEAAGRVQTLESERDAASQRATDAEAALAESRARNTARPIVAEVLAQSTTLPPATVARVTESIVSAAPLTAARELDEAALRTAAETARTAAETEIAEALRAAGAGSVRGFGGGSDGGVEITEADVDKAIAGVFGRTVKES